jgi:hypothetical protein
LEALSVVTALSKYFCCWILFDVIPSAVAREMTFCSSVFCELLSAENWMDSVTVVSRECCSCLFSPTCVSSPSVSFLAGGDLFGSLVVALHTQAVLVVTASVVMSFAILVVISTLVDDAITLAVVVEFERPVTVAERLVVDTSLVVGLAVVDFDALAVIEALVVDIASVLGSAVVDVVALP